jgi:hypothetical protein
MHQPILVEVRSKQSMIGIVKRFLRRRSLRPLLSVLPWALKADYGAAQLYTIGQVRRSMQRKKLAIRLLPSAAAAFCPFDEFQKLEDAPSEALYRELREEIRRLFALDDTGFTAETVRKKRIRQSWNPISHDDGTSSNYSSSGGSDFGHH